MFSCVVFYNIIFNTRLDGNKNLVTFVNNINTVTK